MITPKIVPVPDKMQKFYGKGQMLHPEMIMVVELVEVIPAAKITTVDRLAKQMAKTYGADVACPLRTVNLLKKLSKMPTKVPFWRVINTDHKMLKFENYGQWATLLEQEGFELEFTKSNQIKVMTTENQVFRFTEVF